MAAYKVIQDIEAEDKLLGPLTLRQFIYALIAATCFYFTFLLASKGAAFLTPLFVLPGLVAVFFAIPWSKQQPTEVWALAKIRFIIKPRKRIWDQSGVRELVTITAPKHVEHFLTNGLEQSEVHSRLSALATTLDSRGWAVKNVNVNLSTPAQQYAQSDRLVDSRMMPQEVPNYDVTASDDILDAQNNAVAHQFDTMITQQAAQHRQQIIDRINQAAAQPQAPQPTQQQQQDYWFMNQPQGGGPVDITGQAQFMAAPAVTPGAGYNAADVTTTPEEEAIARAAAQTKQKELQRNMSHMKTVLTLEQQQQLAAQQQQMAAAQKAVDDAIAAAAQAAQPPVTSQPDPATIKYASNNDLDIATIARQAKKDKLAEADEVVVSLH